MRPTPPGTVRLAQVEGITVFVHWTWLLAATFEIGARASSYSLPIWNVVEYLGLFVIILLHEFGHAAACRSVGGRAEQILLWPLGGVAFVDPPTRPGATLWSIAAGPLVNAALIPVFASLTLLVPYTAAPDVHALLRSLTMINVGLLVFNLLPVYPLDGGQILGSLLWFVIGRARSIVVTAFIGLVGVAGIALLALRSFSPWLALVALFVARSCVGSLRLAKSLKQLAAAPPRGEFACPLCQARPPIGPFWTCSDCGAMFDAFDPNRGAVTAPSESVVTTLSLSTDVYKPAANVAPGQCPMCERRAGALKCPECNGETSLVDWPVGPVAERWRVEGVLGVARLRQPRPPSVATLVGSVCIAIVTLALITVTVLFFTVGSRLRGEGAQSRANALGTTASVLATVSAAGAVGLFARYRHKRSEFAEASQRFHSEREERAGA
jgi:Zn-dependent protease